jgi:hypothetical protein
LIVYFVVTNSDTIDGGQATCIYSLENRLINMTSFRLCYNSHKHALDRDFYLGHIWFRGPLQIIDLARVVFEISSLGIFTFTKQFN